MNWRRAALVLGVLAVFPTLLTHVFLWAIEIRLGLNIHRKPLFVLIPGTFEIKGASLEWKDQLQVRAGTVSVEFPPTAVVRPYFPMVIQGKNLSVVFEAGLADSIGQKEVLFDFVDAELVVGGKTGFDIRSLDAESKTIQFHLKGE